MSDAVPRRYNCMAGDFVDGRYKVISLLGEGAFGNVMKVADDAGNIFALKLLRLWEVPSEIRNPLVKRFEMEFETGRIPSPYLVHATDFGYLNGNPYIVMEFCGGGDLNSKKGNPVQVLSPYLVHVLMGLKALHENGKVHRDLKPENVLIKDDGVAALTDFGICGDRNKRMTERNIFGKPSQIFGTYAYMPPEQVNRTAGNSTVLPTTDIFSFGVVAYQMITRSLPFGNLEDQNDLVRYQKKAKSGDWNKDLLAGVQNSQVWKKVIEGCLNPNYKSRIQTIDELFSLLPPHLMTNSESCSRTIKIRSNVSPVVKRTASLKVMQGEDYGRVFDLEEILKNTGRQLVLLGRDSSNDVKLKDFGDSCISRHHFTMESCGDGQWFVRDGQWNVPQGSWAFSLNGTFVNSVQVSENGCKLKNGDIITVGDVKLKFEN